MSVLAGTEAVWNAGTGAKNRQTISNTAFATRVVATDSGVVSGFKLRSSTKGSATSYEIALFTDEGGKPSQISVAWAKGKETLGPETWVEANEELLLNGAGEVKAGQVYWIVIHPVGGSISTWLEKTSGGAQPYKDNACKSLQLPETFTWVVVPEETGPMDAAVLGVRVTGAAPAVHGGGRTTVQSGTSVGYPVVGALSKAFVANRKRVNRYLLPSPGKITGLWFYMEPSGTAGEQKVRAVLYENQPSNLPGALLAQGSDFTFHSTDPAGWYFLPIPSEPFASGDVWIGVHSGTTAEVIKFRYDEATSVDYFDTDTFSDGSSNPFHAGLPSIDDLRLSLYAVLLQTGVQTFGDQTYAGATVEELPVAEEMVCQYEAPPGLISSLTGRLKYSKGEGTAFIRAVAYDDDGAGNPGELLGVSKLIEFPAGFGEAWFTFNFDTPVAFEGGTIHIGYLVGGPAGIIAGYWNEQAGVRSLKEREFVAGAADPFGGIDSTDAHRMVLYATFLPTGWHIRVRGGGKVRVVSFRGSTPGVPRLTGGGRTAVTGSAATPPEAETPPVLEVQGVLVSGGGRTRPLAAGGPVTALIGTQAVWSTTEGAKSKSVAGGQPQATPMVAIFSGVVSSFQFRTGNTVGTATAYEIGLFLDAGDEGGTPGQPGKTLVASAKGKQAPAAKTLLEAAEEPKPGQIKAGQTYWLAILPVGGTIFGLLEKLTGGAAPWQGSGTSTTALSQPISWLVVAEATGPWDAAGVGQTIGAAPPTVTVHGGGRVKTTGKVSAPGVITVHGGGKVKVTAKPLAGASPRITGGGDLNVISRAAGVATFDDKPTGAGKGQGSIREFWAVETERSLPAVGVETPLRSIDPTECWVRHVVRGQAGDYTAKQVCRVYFARDEALTGTDGLNGRQGWQNGEVTDAGSDDGSFTILLPNVAGDDGVLHRRRFRVMTDPAYEPGEEWLEFYREPHDLLCVGTPTDYVKTPGTVTLKGADLNEVLKGAVSSDVDVWDAAAPADVLKHYSRLPVLAFGEHPAVTLTGATGAWSSNFIQAITGLAADCWTVEAQLRWTSAKPGAAGQSYAYVELNNGANLAVDVFDGKTEMAAWGIPAGPSGQEGTSFGRRNGLVVPGSVSVRIVARYDHIFVFVAGELVDEFRRPLPFAAPTSMRVAAFGGTLTIDGVQAETLSAFAGRGSSSVFERTIPGIPPATGLRGQYWNAAPVYAKYSTPAGRLARLWPIGGETPDPAVDRVDPTLNFPLGTPNYPPNIPGAYAARWSGAIFLDLASNDHMLRLKGLSTLEAANARIYVGRTLRGEEAATSWQSAQVPELTTGSLRAWLGNVSGWYPLVIEHTSATPSGIVLEDKVGGGAFAVVPQARLSPLGCYGDIVRLTSHRQIIGDVAQAFGYQWRVEPRSLESGEFPGALTFRALNGRQTDVIVDDSVVGTEAQVSGAASDVLDGLLADAAGFADPSGSGQLTAQVIDYARAGNHLALRQQYESLADISEEPMLRTRLNTLLELRSSPNEQVTARPPGQRDLVDTIPLTGVLAKMNWRAWDALRLALEKIDVRDASPRQMTSVTWTLKPDGVGPPTVSFRQRPRDPKTALRRLSATIYGPRRTYQGSQAIMNGSLGGAQFDGSGIAGAADAFSRSMLPGALSRVTKAILNVHFLAGSGWRMEITGVDLGGSGIVSGAGRYDVTGWLKPQALGVPYAYAKLIGGTSGSYLCSLEVWIIA